jgi:hypothetical protein
MDADALHRLCEVRAGSGVLRKSVTPRLTRFASARDPLPQGGGLGAAPIDSPSTRHASSFPRLVSPEFCNNIVPPIAEGAGNAGRSIAPAALRANEKSTQASHRRSPDTFRHSPRNGFNGCFVLSLVIGLSCHHRRRDAEHRHRVDTSVEMSGPHDFAVRLSAHSSFARQASTASSAQRLVTIAKRPSSRAEDARTTASDLPVAATGRAAANWHDGQIS